MKKISVYIFIIFIVQFFANGAFSQQGKSKAEDRKPKNEAAKLKTDKVKTQIGEGNLKIGTVNIEMLLKNSLAYKAADLEWSRELAKKQEEIDQKRKELEAMMKQLDTLDGDGLKDRNKIESNIEQLKIDLRYLVNDNKKELSEKEKEFFNVISKDIVHVIEEYGKSNGFDYIVNESSILVLFTDVNLDITAEMLIKYNNYWESKKNQSQPAKK